MNFSSFFFFISISTCTIGSSLMCSTAKSLIVDALKYGAASLQRTWLEVSEYFLSIFPMYFEPPKEDNLLTKDKRGCPKVSFIRRFHCICLSMSHSCRLSSVQSSPKSVTSSPNAMHLLYTIPRNLRIKDTLGTA